MKPAFAGLAIAALASGCPATERAPAGTTPAISGSSASRAPDAATDVAPTLGEGTVRRLASNEAPPLEGFRVEGKGGDYLISNDGVVAIVSATTGRLLDFGLEGHDDGLVAIEPAVALGDGLKTERMELLAIEPRGDHVLAARWRIGATSLVLHVFYTFKVRALGIESIVTSEGGAAASVFVGESVNWGNVPTWVERHGYIGGAGTYTGAFVGRQALGVGYALGAFGVTAAHFPPPSPGFWQSARTAEDVGAVAPGGTSRRRQAWLTGGLMGNAALHLPNVRRDVMRSSNAPTIEFRADDDYEIARCAEDAASAPILFAPFRWQQESRGAIASDACLVGRLRPLGAPPGPWRPLADLGKDSAGDAPPFGDIAWRVTEKGSVIPARIVVRGVSPTPDPDWGDEAMWGMAPTEGTARNVIYAAREGSRLLGVGRYRVTVTRGFEYTAREVDVTVAQRKGARVDVDLERVVDTHGWIAADLHLHAAPSPDAPTRLEDRVLSLVAGGVEVGVATDHNVVTDYAPVIKRLGLDKWVTSIIGDEITTKGTLYGHFNLFPLALGGTPVPFERTTPRAIVDASRAATPADRPKVLQLNHPRMGDIGYFDILGFDPKDVAGWQARTPLAELGFDAIEVFNGDHYAQLDQVERCLRDWFALLDAGKRMTATGNSDSHKLAYHEAGVPWNYVQIANDDPAKLDERAFVDAVRKGRVVVSSGPFVRLTANKKEIGDSVSAGDVDIAVRVDAPPWVDVDRVEIVGRGGAILQTWGVKSSTTPKRLDVRTKLALKRGDWIIAIARGTKPMTFLHRPGAKPFAFTNPIFVD